MNEQHAADDGPLPESLGHGASLTSKYDVRGPRYTSYPPANHFGPVDLEALFQRWHARNHLQTDPGLSLYVHIPFCRSRCLFCGCHTFVSAEVDEHEAYVEALMTEMALATRHVDRSRPVRQVALGGGTPNALSPTILERLLTCLEAHFTVEANAERSVELDPRTVTVEQLEVFVTHGFQRFSLGVQDFSEEVLARVHRGQGMMEVEAVVSYLRARGCGQINFDLIYGLPGQDAETARSTAETVLALRPTRVALYSYAHVPWLRPHQRALEAMDGEELPVGEFKMSLFTTVADRLIDGGYVPIGMDHFALPDDPLAVALRHGTLRRSFMGYTTGRGLDVLGLGVSAISAIGSSYAQNAKELDSYLESIEADRLPVFRGFLLSRDDELRREVLQELSCTFRVELEGLSERLGLDAVDALAGDLERLAPHIDDGLVRRDGSTIEVTDQGRMYLRNLCMVFDRYLDQGGSAPRYSRTI